MYFAAQLQNTPKMVWFHQQVSLCEFVFLDFIKKRQQLEKLSKFNSKNIHQ